MELDTLASSVKFVNLSFQQLLEEDEDSLFEPSAPTQTQGENEKVMETGLEQPSINTPLAHSQEDEPITTDESLQTVVSNMQPVAHEQDVNQPALTVQSTDILDEATRQIGLEAWEIVSHSVEQVPAKQWFVSDTSSARSSPTPAVSDNRTKKKWATMKKNLDSQKDQIERLTAARHTLLVVLHNAYDQINNSKNDYITAVNKSAELELSLSVQAFDLMLANTTVDSMTKQLTKAKSLIAKLTRELTIETGQNRTLMYKIIRMENELREHEGASLFPF